MENTITYARAFALAMLNGSLEDAQVIPFLDGLLESGYRGICLHPRDGLLVPYNSRPYWDKIDHIIGLARERGMEVWHYDEFPFPSGAAGGLIPAMMPESRVRALQFAPVAPLVDVNGLIDVGAEPLLALLRFRNENGVWSDVRDVTDESGPHFHTWVWGHWHNRFYTGTHLVREALHERAGADRYTIVYRPESPLEDDELLLAVRLHTIAGQKGQAGKPDIMQPAVTDAFLQLIYTRFAELSRRHDLKSTPVFQDEVTFDIELPWNGEIERRLSALWGERAQCGDTWATKLLALHGPSVAGWELARYEYRAACGEAIEENWFARVARFCHENGLSMTGHLPGEESIFMHCQLMGDAFKALRHFDIPGYDIISPGVPDEHSSQSIGAKVVQSVAWLEGRPSMVEVFGANGFQNDLQENRSVVGWLAAHDIWRVFDHSTYLSALGVRKYDAPPVNNRFNPLDVARDDLWRWHDWFCDLMEQFQFQPRALLLFPVDALARFCGSEEEHWRSQTELLESWFSVACAHTLDLLLLPAHVLEEVEATDDGFKLHGHTFQTLLVPPVHSLHQSTYDGLQRFADHAGFCWCAPDESASISVFGAARPNGEPLPIVAPRIVTCTAPDLAQSGAAWFEPLLDSPAPFKSAQTLLHSLRRDESGNELLIVFNPHDQAVEAHLDDSLSAVVQPPNDFTPPVERDGIGAHVVLAPRDVQLFRREETENRAASTMDGTIELRPQDGRFRWEGDNFLSLKHGIAALEGFHDVLFAPIPISSSWRLDVPFDQSEAIYAPPFSSSSLPQPLHLKVTFEIAFEESLDELAVLIDDESLPPQAQMWWDDVLLCPQTRAVFDVQNTVYEIPASALSAGRHRLKIEAPVANAAHGVLERPILLGRFLVTQDQSPAPSLRAMTRDWTPLPIVQSWPDLGMPEGFGPVEYEMNFELSEDDARQRWALHLPPCVGVACVELNGQFVGRSSWEPRVLPLPPLTAGKSVVCVRLFGSWNNVFSALNRVSNGLSGEATLRPILNQNSQE